MKYLLLTKIFTLFLAFQGTLLFAATPVSPCDASTIERKVSTCAPDVTLNITSIGTVYNWITNVPFQSSIVSSIFDTSVPVARILNSSSTSHVSFYGQSKPYIFGGTSKRVLVNITNWTNSSSVGISQLLTSQSIAIAGYADNAFYGYTQPSTTQAGCFSVDSSIPLAPVLGCPITSISYKPNFVISYVEPSEYQALNNPVSGTLGKLSLIRSTPTFLQGFGIAVNDRFYRALQGQNLRDGVLPASCSVGDMTGACQPSIKQAQLSSLFSKEGKVKAVSDLISGDTTPLTLNQAELTHATKAAQNMLLLNYPCGLPANKTKSNAALNPLGATNGSTKLQIAETYKTNNEVGIAISTGSGYQIGMQPLGSNALFIKLDAISPNFDINGQAAYPNRTQTANGLNPLATMTYSVRMVKEDAGVKAVADAFWLALQSSAWSDIAGLAYIDGAEDNPTSPKQSKVQRLQNTNCSPLIVSKNTGVRWPSSFPSSTAPPVPPSIPPSYNYTIAGTLSGLDAGQTLTILNIDNESITLSSDGAFIFSKPRLPGTIYSVSIKEHTSDRLCIVSQGSGTLVSNVTNVSVMCLPPVVSTLAGSGQQGSTNGTGTNASFFVPNSVAVDSSGILYVADTSNHLIRKINSSGVVTTFAGTGQIGSVNGTGTDAGFNTPNSVAVDSSGNLYVADTSNHLIRKINSSGVVTTFAGTGQIGSVNGTGTKASFQYPNGIAVDSLGNVFVADTGNNLIRKINPSGVVTTFAGTGQIGNSNTSTDTSFNSPSGIAVDTLGNVFVADTLNHQIRKINSSGVVTTFAGNGQQGSANGTGIGASFNGPRAIAVDSSGNVYVADDLNNLIRKIKPSGLVTTLAGTGQLSSVNGTGTDASFNRPRGITVDKSGNLFVADSYNHLIRKITFLKP